MRVLFFWHWSNRSFEVRTVHQKFHGKAFMTSKAFAHKTNEIKSEHKIIHKGDVKYTQRAGCSWAIMFTPPHSPKKKKLTESEKTIYTLSNRGVGMHVCSSDNMSSMSWLLKCVQMLVKIHIVPDAGSSWKNKHVTKKTRKHDKTKPQEDFCYFFYASNNTKVTVQSKNLPNYSTFNANLHLTWLLLT